jgi:hypothetical protein
MAYRQDLLALRKMVIEAEKLLSAAEPNQHSTRAHELLSAASRLADSLIETTPAAVIGAKGGKSTAKRGSEYFRQIAAKRKTRAGGRPKKHE